MQRAKLFAYINNIDYRYKAYSAGQTVQIRCFPYVELSDIPRLQQVEKKAIGRPRNLGLPLDMV
jgi:hypothetical protein